MSTYGYVLLFSIIGPALFSFHKSIRIYRHWIKVMITTVVVSIPFLIWDAMATARGDWGFSAKHIGTFKLFGLPIEEILFF